MACALSCIVGFCLHVNDTPSGPGSGSSRAPQAHAWPPHTQVPRASLSSGALARRHVVMEIDRGRTISIIIGSLVEAELAHSPSSARTNQEQEQHDLDVRHGRVAMLANSGFLPPCLVRKIDFLVEVLKQIRERAGPSVSEEMLMAGNRLPALDTEYPYVDFTGDARPCR